MMGAAQAIEQATKHLQKLISQPRDSSRYNTVDIQVHDSILNAALAITGAIACLIKATTNSHREIVAEGKGSSTGKQFYKKHNRWTEGLISAARSVVFATNLLIAKSTRGLAYNNGPAYYTLNLLDSFDQNSLKPTSSTAGSRAVPSCYPSNRPAPHLHSNTSFTTRDCPDP